MTEKEKQKTFSKDLEEEIRQVAGDYEQVEVAWNNDFEFIARHFAEWGKNQTEAEIQAQSIVIAHGCPKEEPESKDIDSFASIYAHNIKSDGNQLYGYHIEDAVKAGAKWQEQLMIGNAIDGEITYGKSLSIPSLGYILDKNGLDFGDKIKLLILKED